MNDPAILGVTLNGPQSVAELETVTRDVRQMAREKFRSAMKNIISRYPYREIELKALGLVWEVTNFTASVVDADSLMPSKIPVLIGPTSTGKSLTVSEFGKNLEAYMRIILLAQENPDEVAGYLVPASQNINDDGATSGYGKYGYHLSYGKPEWFQELENFSGEFRIVFLDELDKPPKELHAPILTFIRNKMLRKWQAPTYTLVVGAMNPTEASLDPAFIARCIFIPWLHSKDHYSSLFPAMSDLIGNFNYDGVNSITFPALPKEPDLSTLHFLDAAKKHPWFWEKDVRELIVRGMFAKESVETILDAFSSKLNPSKKILARNPALTRKIILAMNEEDVIMLYREMYPIATNCDVEETMVFGEFNYWMWEYGRWGSGERAYKVQQMLSELPLETHAKLALDKDTWVNVVKPILNGDGTIESFKKSFVWANIVNRWNLENPSNKYSEYDENDIVYFGDEVREVYKQSVS